jgi:UPF0271 protein
MNIDLNCDLGEGMPHDAEIIPYITSANIACCLHAGTPGIALQTMRLCQLHDVAIGAHPGYADREHFGRRELHLDWQTLLAELLFQLHGFIGLAKQSFIEVQYLKPHGALYNQAMKQDDIAAMIATTASSFQLPILGLPQSSLQESLKEIDSSLAYFHEGFADRRYRTDGTLVPRSEANALIDDPQEALAQVEWLIREKQVHSICVHGDHPQAVEFVRRLHESLIQQGYQLKSFL